MATYSGTSRTRKPAAIVIDFDDTLVATRSTRGPLLAELLTDHGGHVTPGDIERHWGLPFLEVIAAVAPDVDWLALDVEYQQLLQSRPPTLLPGSRELLSDAAILEVPVLIATSSRRKLVEIDLETSGLKNLVARIWGHEELVYAKPHTKALEPVRAWLSERGISSENAVYIGDSLADLAAARDHFRFLAVTTGLHRSQDFISAGVPEFAIHDRLPRVATVMAGSVALAS